MRLKKEILMRSAGKTAGFVPFTNSFGLIVRETACEAGVPYVVWSWSDTPDALHASVISLAPQKRVPAGCETLRLEPDAGETKYRFRAGKNWVRLDEVQRA